MVNKQKILSAIKEAKQAEKKKFTQSVDLVMSLKDFDLKKDKLEEFIKLPNGRGKKAKICALVGAELKDQAEKLCDKIILDTDFSKWADKRKCKKLTREFDFFLAQANIMPQIAKIFGKYFGPLGKMPNPKAGQIVPPKANIASVITTLRDTIRIAITKSPVINCSIGNETFEDEKLAENVVFAIEQITNHLPMNKQNIGRTFVKLTMGKSVEVKSDAANKNLQPLNSHGGSS